MKYHRILYCLLLIVLPYANSLSAQESDPLQGMVIPGSAEHEPIRFGVLLPPSYGDSQGAYPVIYYLHGANQYYLASRAQWIAAFFNKQFLDGKIPACIMVFVDGGEGYWMDHYDGAPLLETDIVDHLVPYMDKNYRTIPSKRIIMGYSMGGNGAAFFYTKHPELFAAAASLDGGIVSYEDYLLRTGGRPEIISNEDYFFEFGSPYGWVKRNRSALLEKPDTSILLTAGFLVEANREFLSLLEEEGIPAKYVEFGYDHEFGFVFSESQEKLVQFLSKRLSLPDE